MVVVPMKSKGVAFYLRFFIGVCLLFILTGNIVFAGGAFGIEFGMTLEQVKKVIKKDVEVDEKSENNAYGTVYIIQPIVENEFFETYRIVVDEKYGVIEISAETKATWGSVKLERNLALSGEPSLGKLRKDFATTASALESKYGSHYVGDNKNAGNNENAIMVCQWCSKFGSKLPSDIDMITLLLVATNNKKEPFYNEEARKWDRYGDRVIRLIYSSQRFAQKYEEVNKAGL